MLEPHKLLMLFLKVLQYEITNVYYLILLDTQNQICVDEREREGERERRREKERERERDRGRDKDFTQSSHSLTFDFVALPVIY